VKLPGTSPGRISVNYATANNTAIAGLDYTRVSGTLTFNPGETTKTLAVPILSDSLLEPNETFSVNLSNPDNARISDSSGIGTIVNTSASTQLLSASSTTLATTSQINSAGGSWFMNDLVQNSDPVLISGTSTTTPTPISSPSLRPAPV
jgi:hypothetical protein